MRMKILKQLDLFLFFWILLERLTPHVKKNPNNLRESAILLIFGFFRQNFFPSNSKNTIFFGFFRPRITGKMKNEIKSLNRLIFFMVFGFLFYRLTPTRQKKNAKNYAKAQVFWFLDFFVKTFFRPNSKNTLFHVFFRPWITGKMKNENVDLLTDRSYFCVFDFCCSNWRPRVTKNPKNYATAQFFWFLDFFLETFFSPTFQKYLVSCFLHILTPCKEEKWEGRSLCRLIFFYIF